ncbi:MAG: DsrE family protein [Bacteroidales bacterium]|nr:DsrE family protein [Bacteroidales bacterium]
MKKLIFLLISISVLNLLTINTMAQTEKLSEKSDTLCILWTSGDPDVAIKMVLMYANAAKQNKWFDEVELIIWGPSSKLTSENSEIQETLTNMMKKGVKIEACKACADQYGVSDKLKSLGIDVKYMGKPLTNILKSDKKLITF